ncbi:MAG: Hpt domain-containing protein [Bdellovibrionales bacterium]
MHEISSLLRNRYLQRRLQDAKTCSQKIHQQDWAYFCRLGHQLKGNAASYGFEDLAGIAERMETGATHQDSRRLEEALEEFRSWILKNPAIQDSSESLLLR